MGWCKVGAGDGAKAVADMLMYNGSMRRLDLRGNGFGNDGALLRCAAVLRCAGAALWDGRHAAPGPANQHTHLAPCATFPLRPGRP